MPLITLSYSQRFCLCATPSYHVALSCTLGTVKPHHFRVAVRSMEVKPIC